MCHSPVAGPFSTFCLQLRSFIRRPAPDNAASAACHRVADPDDAGEGDLGRVDTAVIDVVVRNLIVSQRATPSLSEPPPTRRSCSASTGERLPP
jgi:hypothetical protein